MRISATLRPAQQGTPALLTVHDDGPVSVRHRCDAGNRRRLKTGELVVDEVPRICSPPLRAPTAASVGVATRHDARELRERLDRAGTRG